VLFVLWAVGAAARGDEIHYPYRVEGACPSECCHYGTWTAREAIPVEAGERERSDPAFVLEAGQAFQAVGGAYWTLAPLVLRTKVPLRLLLAQHLALLTADRAALRESSRADAFALFPVGTEIHVLVELGDGAAIGLAEGRPVELGPGMYDSGGGRDLEVLAPRAPEGGTEWWIEVKAGDRHGWFERGHYAIEGTKRCE
jgi:hypothetical protein